MCGTNARHIRKTLVRLVSCTCRHSVRVKSAMGLRMFMPALLMRICTFPNRRVAAASTRRTCSSSVMSAGQIAASPPSERTSLAVFWSCDPSRETNKSRAPSAPNARAIALPNPLLAPVMIVTLPVRFSWFISRRVLKFLQSLAPAVAGVEVVPEFDVFLVLFPAQENFLAADDGWEIQQAAFQVLDHDLALLKLPQYLLSVGERANPVVDEFAAHVVAGIHQAAEALVKSLQFATQMIQLLQPLAHLRQKGFGLLARVMLFVAIVHQFTLATFLPASLSFGTQSVFSASNFFCTASFFST